MLPIGTTRWRSRHHWSDSLDERTRGNLEAMVRDLAGRVDARLRDVSHRLVSGSEGRTRSGPITFLIGAAVGFILQYS